jgi:anti-sigma-K factor RskA
MASPTAGNWRTSIVNLAISALFVAIALRIAFDLIRSVAPELIIAVVVIVLAHGGWTAIRIRRSRW